MGQKYEDRYYELILEQNATKNITLEREWEIRMTS